MNYLIGLRKRLLPLTIKYIISYLQAAEDTDDYRPLTFLVTFLTRVIYEDDVIINKTISKQVL